MAHPQKPRENRRVAHSQNGIPKNKYRTSGIFFNPKIRPSIHHKTTTIHHTFTIKKPRPNTRFPQNPQQKHKNHCAKNKSTLRVNLPMEVVALNCWVTETKLIPCLSNCSTILAKSARERVSRSTL